MTYASEWTRVSSTLERCGAGIHLAHGEAAVHAEEIVADGTRA